MQQCWSIFLGEGIFERWEDNWRENKVIGAYGMENMETQYQLYRLDTEVTTVTGGGVINVFGFMGTMDAETGNDYNKGNGNDTHVVIRCVEFDNPDVKKLKGQFTISLQTNRYTYKGGPMTILE
jgi:hypothetical protein